MGLLEVLDWMRHHEQLWSVNPNNIPGHEGGHTEVCTHFVQAAIDQVEGLLTFNSGSEQLLTWDQQIHSLCATLNDVIDSATARQKLAASA